MIAPLSFMAAAHQWVPPAQLVFSPCSTSPRFHGSFSHNPFGRTHRELRVCAASQAAASMAGWSEVLFETIEELSRKVREPAEVLADCDGRLTAREIRLVLVYFAQEGRDCWCALEVYDWLQRGRGVDEETAELMVSIMCQWVERLVGRPHGIGEVVELLKDMDCVGLRARFSMIEKVIGLYWEMGKKEAAVGFVEEVLRKGVEFVEEGSKGGPAGYLAWKFMVDGDYVGAIKWVMYFKEGGLQPGAYSYLIALTALVKEQNELSKTIRKFKGLAKEGRLAELDAEDINLLEKYQMELIKNSNLLSKWAVQVGGSSLLGVVHERLLAIYTCAGRGLEAENQLWQMKLAGREPDRELYNVVLAICASQMEIDAVKRLLMLKEMTESRPRKKTLTWLLRGYVKGGHFADASQVLVNMLDMGFIPEYLDRVAVLQGLRRNMERADILEAYLMLCKRLANAELIGPCLLYLHVTNYSLWIMRML